MVNLSANPLLERLDGSGNSLTTIDLSSNPLLTFIDLSDNMLTSIDLSNQTALDSLDLANNDLSILDLLRNPLLSFLDTRGNTGLTCIAVPDVTAAQNNPNFFVDMTTSFSTNCSGSGGGGSSTGSTAELPVPKWALFMTMLVFLFVSFRLLGAERV